jgi:hypothetical protein
MKPLEEAMKFAADAMAADRKLIVFVGVDGFVGEGIDVPGMLSVVTACTIPPERRLMTLYALVTELRAESEDNAELLDKLSELILPELPIYDGSFDFLDDEGVTEI